MGEKMKDNKQVLSHESESLFKEGIAMILSKWASLQFAIDSGYGGHKSRQIVADQFVSDIFYWFVFSTGPLEVFDLREIIHELLLLINTDLLDGEVEKIADKFVALYNNWLDGNFEYIKALRESSSPRVHVRQRNDDHNVNDSMNEGSSKMIVGSSKSLSNSEDMLVDEPMPKPSGEAEAEWKVAGPKRRRRKGTRF